MFSKTFKQLCYLLIFTFSQLCGLLVRKILDTLFQNALDGRGMLEGEPQVMFKLLTCFLYLMIEFGSQCCFTYASHTHDGHYPRMLIYNPTIQIVQFFFAS